MSYVWTAVEKNTSPRFYKVKNREKKNKNEQKAVYIEIIKYTPFF